MTTPQPEPITNQEIPVLADRVARALIADMLADCRIYLGDLIDEEIDKDPDAKRLDPHTHGLVYGLLWDQLGRAGADYQHREQVLAEAAGHLDRIADATEAEVAKYYGPASGIGPGSADMVREAAKTVRALATQPTT